ncbi:urotensin-2-like [Spinachia spinachia]
MKCDHLVSWAFLLVACGPLLAHPIAESEEMLYPGPVSAEDGGIGALVDLFLSEQNLPSRDALRYSSLTSGEYDKDGVGAGPLPRGTRGEVRLEKQSLLNPFSRPFGIRKQFRKRAGNSECFWKYCV